MVTVTLNLPNDRHERLKHLAQARNTSLEQLFDDLARTALAEFDAQAKPFPPTRLEDVAGCAGYTGPRHSVEDMERAIDEELGARHDGGRY